MKKKSSITFDEFLEKDPKFKKKFNKEFEKYQNRPKPNKKLKIGLKYIKKHFNLDLFLKKIEKYNYRYMDEGNMLDRVIGYGFEQKEVYKILINNRLHVFGNNLKTIVLFGPRAR